MAVTLLSDDGPLWSPDDLLKILETGVSWEQIQTMPDTVKLNALTKSQGATPWASVHIEAPSLEGIVDPALEWMYTKGLVYQERDEWVDIRCPWHHEHSEGGQDRAGYSPLGWGTFTHNKQKRSFNCFHDSCNGRHAQDFLDYVGEQGGPAMPVRDHVPEMVSRYVYDRDADGAWDMFGHQKSPQTITSMKNEYARPVFIARDGSKAKPVSPVHLWLTSGSRVLVDGSEYRPGERNKLFRDEHGSLYYNLFYMKPYLDRAVDHELIKPFFDYLDYLIPDDTERTYFLDWLACKVQDPTFRGPAIFMVAEKQGIGRNTLMSIISSMFGSQNMAHIPFGSLVKGGGFNDYQESLFVVVDETLALDDYTTGRKASDKLKEVIDPRPQRTIVNPKYGRQRIVWSVSSYIFLSNHIDGLQLTVGDRRYYALRNAFEPMNPRFFVAINQWLDGKEWQEHLWNALMAREVDTGVMTAPPEQSETMTEVIEAGLTPLSCAVQGFGYFWPTPLVPVRLCRAMIDVLGGANEMFPPKNLDYIFRKVWKENYPASAPGSSPMVVNRTGYKVGIKGGERLVNGGHPDWQETVLTIKEYNEQVMAAKVMRYMEERGFTF